MQFWQLADYYHRINILTIMIILPRLNRTLKIPIILIILVTKNLTLKDISSVLFFSGGITREIKYDNNTLYMRAASATGALYPIEMYIICNDISPDLKSGIYHFNPAEFSLTSIRKGDYRSLLASYNSSSSR